MCSHHWIKSRMSIQSRLYSPITRLSSRLTTFRGSIVDIKSTVVLHKIRRCKRLKLVHRRVSSPCLLVGSCCFFNANNWLLDDRIVCVGVEFFCLRGVKRHVLFILINHRVKSFSSFTWINVFNILQSGVSLCLGMLVFLGENTIELGA